MMGFTPVASFANLPFPTENKNPEAKDFLQRIVTACENAKEAIAAAAIIMTKYYNRTKGLSPNFKVGDLVWLEGNNITTIRPMKKLDDKRYGPFTIEEKVGPSSYKLRLPSAWSRIHPVFNEVLLLPFKHPEFSQQEMPGPVAAVKIDDNQEWEVEFIRDSRRRRWQLQYLVHWKDWPDEDDTWEPLKNLANATQAIHDFYARHPKSIR